MRFIWPLANPAITRSFAYLSNIYIGGQHAALDLVPRGRSATGEPIRAVADGVVAGVGWDFYSGFFVAVDHAGGWRSIYRHLYGQTPVSLGQRVRQGQVTGNIGNTGYSLGAHLHFDLWCTTKHDPTAFAKHGLWAHDPELDLGKEDSMEPELGKVSPPSVAALEKLPGEFKGKWPDWNIGAFIRYGFALLRRRDNRIAALVLRIKVLEQLKNPCNFGIDHATMSERMGQYRTAIKVLQEAVTRLETSAGQEQGHSHTATVTSEVELH